VSAAEGSPSVVKEMLASGLLVIVSDAGDNRTVVQDGRIGVVVHDVSPHSVEAALRTALALGDSVYSAALGSVAQYSLPRGIRHLERLLDDTSSDPPLR
jgi:glycosyltransferase involved in cell wall biosynthesis